MGYVPIHLWWMWSAAFCRVRAATRRECQRDQWFPLAAAVLVVLIFGVMQWGGGAYQAEYTGHSDEPSHFMVGLLLRDYAVQWPLPAARPWAEQYYLHYPRAALGHWPPLFHLLEAAWWLIVEPARATAMVLIGCLALGSAVAFYRLARGIIAPAWALGSSVLFAMAPVFQHSAGQVMAEQLCLLLGILFLGRLIAFTGGGGRRDMFYLALLCCLSLLAKGTGLSLVVAPALALALSRQGIDWRMALCWVGAFTAIIGLLAAWYWFRSGSLGQMLSWAGMAGGLDWTAAPLMQLAGPGVAIAAAAGFLWHWKEREPVAVSCAAVCAATVWVSFIVRAMHETRHWIAVLPALFLLALLALRQILRMESLFRRRALLSGFIALVLGLFPWTYYRQSNSGVAQVVYRLKRPARLLVSAQNSQREGIWVPAMSVGEARPSSIVVRSTKSIATESFSGFRYKLNVTSAKAVGAWLDRHGIDVVVLDEHGPALHPPPHHALVRAAVETGGGWQPCVREGQLSTYCRTTTPAGPRERIEIRVNRSLVVRER
jgi:hypothetical protein